MRLTIHHETLYRYTDPVGYLIQHLRLTPRADSHQHTLAWHIATAAPMYPFMDAFGNHSHIVSYTMPLGETRIVADGVVNILPLDRGRLPDKGPLSPLVFTVPTRLTQPDQSIEELARRLVPPSPCSNDLLALAEAINDSVTYETGSTLVTSTAAESLRLGRGVCQDHAHLFLACCHALGIPARYVSGYIDTGTTQNAESHAWVDVWVEEPDFIGWVSIDVTHARFQGDRLCRLAVGRDYDSAAPVRGIRRGGGTESLAVDVRVITQAQLPSQAQ